MKHRYCRMSRLKVLVVHNPASGLRGNIHSPEAVKRFLTGKNIEWVWHTTEPTGLDKAFDRLLDRTIERILIIGGDGTIRQVAQYMMDRRIVCPLAIIPQGSGNVLAKNLGIPRLFLKRALKIAVGDKMKKLDVLRINRRHIALVGAGQGFDVAMMERVSRKLKQKLGFGAYLFAFFKSFTNVKIHDFVITVDGKRSYISASIVVALNAFSPRRFLKDHEICPHDGRVNVIAIRSRSGWEALRQGFKCLTRRSKIPKGVTVFSGKERITIKQLRASQIQFDGDVMKGRSLTIDILSRRLPFIVPV